MMYYHFPELICSYLDSLKGRSSHSNAVRVASQWIIHQQNTPNRRQILDRMKAKCPGGDFSPCATQANKEMSLIRAACRWGIYEGTWNGGDPTVGIKKWKTPKRKRVCKFEEIRKILHAFDFAVTETDIRDRALFGIAMFTGCRPSEIRTAQRHAITPYGPAGSWNKGKTKTGEDQELPVPRQVMGWLADWLKMRPQFDPRGTNPFLFPGQGFNKPLSEDAVRKRWAALRKGLEIPSNLWSYDLRRTLATYLKTRLGFDDTVIRAILNHYDGSALSHYCHMDFDALVPVIQQYADWLWAFKQEAMVPAVMPTIQKTEERVLACASVSGS